MDYIRVAFALEPKTYSRLLLLSRRMRDIDLEEIIDQSTSMFLADLKIRQTSEDQDRLRAERQAGRWNSKYLLGQAVVFEADDGCNIQTKTVSEAFVNEDGDVVIRLKDIKGYCLLSRVKRLLVKASEIDG